MTTEAYPLSWPAGRGRCSRRQNARFVTTFARARDELLDELRRLGATSTVLSTNIPLRRDGLPYAGQANPDDPGVAVYFTRKGKPMCFCCDRWRKVQDNLLAIVKTIEAIRGIERWGTGEAVEAAFAGFEALPPPKPKARPWWEVLDLPAHASTNDVQYRYALLARVHHPDRGGDHATMTAINNAFDEFKKERGL